MSILWNTQDSSLSKSVNGLRQILTKKKRNTRILVFCGPGVSQPSLPEAEVTLRPPSIASLMEDSEDEKTVTSGNETDKKSDKLHPKGNDHVKATRGRAFRGAPRKEPLTTANRLRRSSTIIHEKLKPSLMHDSPENTFAHVLFPSRTDVPRRARSQARSRSRTSAKVKNIDLATPFTGKPSTPERAKAKKKLSMKKPTAKKTHEKRDTEGSSETRHATVVKERRLREKQKRLLGSIAQPAFFAANPALVWQYFEHQRYLSLHALPNPVHRVLADMAFAWGENLLCISMVTDNLLEKARFPNDRLVLLNGSLFEARCSNENCSYTRPYMDKNAIARELQSTHTVPFSLTKQGSSYQQQHHRQGVSHPTTQAIDDDSSSDSSVDTLDDSDSDSDIGTFCFSPSSVDQHHDVDGKQAASQTTGDRDCDCIGVCSLTCRFNRPTTLPSSSSSKTSLADDPVKPIARSSALVPMTIPALPEPFDSVFLPTCPVCGMDPGEDLEYRSSKGRTNQGEGAHGKIYQTHRAEKSEDHLPHTKPAKNDRTKALVRPNVVWEGEEYPTEALRRIDKFMQGEDKKHRNSNQTNASTNSNVNGNADTSTIGTNTNNITTNNCGVDVVLAVGMGTERGYMEYLTHRAKAQGAQYIILHDGSGGSSGGTDKDARNDGHGNGHGRGPSSLDRAEADYIWEGNLVDMVPFLLNPILW